MQDQYVGDIGDFGKYGLLRHLTGMRSDAAPEDALRLGVVWYLFPDGGNNDGKFTDYLCNPKPRDSKLRDCDPELYDDLYNIVVEKKDRRVVRVQESGILAENTAYYERCLSYEPGESPSSKKLRREAWLEGALEATAKANVVFVDPDNGIAIPDKGEANQATGITKVDQYSKRGPKYVLMDDLRKLYGCGQSLVIYHHLTRQDKAPQQINGLARRLQQCLNLPRLPWSLWYHRGTARVYFIVAQERHEPIILDRLQEFKRKSCWFERQTGFKHPHFELVTPTEG